MRLAVAWQPLACATRAPVPCRSVPPPLSTSSSAGLRWPTAVGGHWAACPLSLPQGLGLPLPAAPTLPPCPKAGEGAFPASWPKTSALCPPGKEELARPPSLRPHWLFGRMMDWREARPGLLPDPGTPHASMLETRAPKCP